MKSKFPIRSPEDLRELKPEALPELATRIRETIIEICLKSGGHLGASLGAVELALALHREFDSPRDSILWDVGHQAYAHKLITGRAERFDTLRQTGGISGFLSREESEHDAFGAGHSSTALSAALGISWAKRDAWTVAVVGDGGMTAGLTLEALNNIVGRRGGPLLLVLNDNRMSISENVGGIARILASGMAKSFFESLGLEYRGPVDGHDLVALAEELRNIRGTPLAQASDRPIVLHTITKKGRGYAPAENAPITFHGVSPAKKGPAATSFSEAFGSAICRLAESDPKIVAVTAAMTEGTGLVEFAKRFPERFFDVGIAEQHAVTFAAGLATQGYRPVVAIYSTFLQRAYDSIIHDVCLQGLGVTFAIDRAGLVGADGPTHHGAFDLAYLGPIPNLAIQAPRDYADLEKSLTEAVVSGKPRAIRFPRGNEERTGVVPDSAGLSWHAKPESPDSIIVALGPAATRAAKAAALADPSHERVAVVSTVDVKPVSTALIRFIDAHPDVLLLTLEDGVVRGGFGESLVAALAPRPGWTKLLGYPDRFIPHGKPSDLEDLIELSPGAIAQMLCRRNEST